MSAQPEPMAPLAAGEAGRPPLLRRLLGAAAPFAVLLALLVAFRLAVGPSFWGVPNLQNVTNQAVLVLIGAVGMTIIIIGGGIDLSCGAVVALCAVLTARILAPVPELAADASDHERWCAWLAGIPDGTAILVAVGVGITVGLANGALIVGLRQMPFIVTLGMMGIARGAAKWQADEKSVNFRCDWFRELMQWPGGRGSLLPPMPALGIAAALVVAVGLLLARTVFGRHVYAVGSNEAAARLCGIRVGATKIAMYALGGACFGLAGAFSAARLSVGDPTTAISYELDVIAAVIVGGASLAGGRGTVIGSVIGALLMAVLRNGTNQLDWPNYVQEMIIGSAIVIAVALDRLRLRGRT